MNKGFTLIELSIVLVIIGLIVGGVLVGRDLIEAAQVRALISEQREYATAINIFRSKYNAMPGDLTTTQATGFSMQPTTRDISDNTMIGLQHGDGIIQTCRISGVQYDALGSEGTLFWSDLSSAGLINGVFNTATDTIVTGATQSQIALYLPVSKLKNSYWAATSGGSCGNGADDSMRFGPPTNIFYLGSIRPHGGARYFYGEGALNPVQAYQFDSKLDDGNPWTGRIRGVSNTSENMLGYNNAYIGAADQPHCMDTLTFGYGTADKYNIDSFPNDQVCALNIRF